MIEATKVCQFEIPKDEKFKQHMNAMSKYISVNPHNGILKKN